MDKAREVPRWRQSLAFTPLEREVMQYAEAMTETPPAVTDEMAERLLMQLGAPALVELTAFIGLANMASRTNEALGIEGQGLSTACGLPPLATPAADVASGARATTRSSPTAACSSPWPVRCSARGPTPRTPCSRPGCGGRTWTVVRCATRGPTWCGWSPAPGPQPAAHARAPTGGVRRRVAARAGAHRPPTSPRTSSSPRACRSRCSPCWRRWARSNARCSCCARSSTCPTTRSPTLSARARTRCGRSPTAPASTWARADHACR